MERSLDSLAGMAKSAFGAGTSAAMRQATSPKTILEYIINFFTCGGIRRRNETQYQELIETDSGAQCGLGFVQVILGQQRQTVSVDYLCHKIFLLEGF